MSGRLREDAVATGEDVGGARGGLAAEFAEAGAGRRGDVPANDGETGGVEAFGDGAAHQAKTDQTNGAIATDGFEHGHGLFIAGSLYSPTRELRYFPSWVAVGGEVFVAISGISGIQTVLFSQASGRPSRSVSQSAGRLTSG